MPRIPRKSNKLPRPFNIVTNDANTGISLTPANLGEYECPQGVWAEVGVAWQVTPFLAAVLFPILTVELTLNGTAIRLLGLGGTLGDVSGYVPDTPTQYRLNPRDKIRIVLLSAVAGTLTDTLISVLEHPIGEGF